MNLQMEHFGANSHIINNFPKHNISQQIESPFRKDRCLHYCSHIPVHRAGYISRNYNTETQQINPRYWTLIHCLSEQAEKRHILPIMERLLLACALTAAPRSPMWWYTDKPWYSHARTYSWQFLSPKQAALELFMKMFYYLSRKCQTTVVALGN